MVDFASQINEKLAVYGFKYKTVHISHLPELLETVRSLSREGILDKPVIDVYGRYFTEASNKPPDTKTVIVVAMPSPITRVTFTLPEGILYTNIPPQYIGRADDTHAATALKSVLEPAGHTVVRANLPLKTLAVRSGLARYGRNNIAYVPSMGSFFRLIAFYTDYEFTEDNWQTSRLMQACEKCYRCGENCPTKCIDTDRFVAHAARCLTFLNESEPDFPDWVKPEWHNALIGCMKCQDVCPVNKKYLKPVKNGPVFDIAETTLILGKTPFEKLPEATKHKLSEIAYDSDGLYRFLARNLGVLVKKI
ncbi:MAG: 4Fe-4S double cluster binding domain-containing protein [Dehalococcoidales bacterium]|nr:4Fe-4S double cluster binding domain-containing protein [Dehalococcoidales bacterium]